MTSELATMLDTIEVIDPATGAEFRTVASLATDTDQEAALVGLGEKYLTAMLAEMGLIYTPELLDGIIEMWKEDSNA